MENSPKPADQKQPLNNSITTPEKTLQRWTLPLSSHDNNYNWSPDTVLLRSRQHLCPTPCDIITGVPLPARERPPPADHRARERAPLLTMRDRERYLKGGSRLGFGGPFSKLSKSATPQGCRLAGEGLSGQAIKPRDSVYSRHSLSSLQPSSHALIRPDHDSPDGTRSNRPT